MSGELTSMAREAAAALEIVSRILAARRKGRDPRLGKLTETP